jgi:hypothetical protein
VPMWRKCEQPQGLSLHRYKPIHQNHFRFCSELPDGFGRCIFF